MNNPDCNTLLKKIGDTTREHRKKRKLSQFKLGVEVGKSANQIGRIERGESNPTINTLHSLANFFEIDIKDFFE